MLRFSSPDVAKAAAALKLTEQDLNHCIQHPELSECQRRLEELKKRVKKSYREAALELHPDRTGGDEEKLQLFKTVSRLWEQIQKFEIGRQQRPQPRVVHVRATPSTSWGGWTTWSNSTTTTGSW